MPLPAPKFLARIAPVFLAGLLSLPGLALGQSPEETASPAPTATAVTVPVTVLVTGANRGIGYEIARQYAARGYQVIATARQPKQANALNDLARETGRIRVEKLDVTDEDDIRDLAAKYRDTPIDILVNNAGILGDNDKQKFGTFDYDAFDAVMDTNCKGPIRMVEAFVDQVAASNQKKIMNVSSFVGSIERTFGGQVFYRSSKACLNMAMRTLAMEFKRAQQPGRKEIIMGMINPGVVDTGFGGKLPIPMIQADKSAQGVIAMIDEYDRSKSGDFYDYTGAELPW